MNKLSHVLPRFAKIFVTALVVCSSQGFAQNTLPSVPISDSDFLPVNEQQAKLGQQLFYDKLLSGNRNIACGTCHHHDHGTSDGLSLGIGEGGMGLGPERIADSKLKHRVPRHAPALFNLGAKEFSVLFHDGRLTIDHHDPTGFNSPAEEFLPGGLADLVAAQALFPLTSAVEMAGDLHENQVSGAVRRRMDYAWTIIVERIRHTPGYLPLFQQAFTDVQRTSDIEIHHVVNAISAFERFEWRADNSPFDQFLAGNSHAMTSEQKAGMELFYEPGSCGECHQGTLQTDHGFHSIGLPQFGPGRTRRFDNKNRDMGRINETDRAEDVYRFRTPSLRNVTATAPYGHNGAYQSLEAMVRHHLEPQKYFNQYDFTQAVLPSVPYLDEVDFLIGHDPVEKAVLLRSIDVDLPEFSDLQVAQLLAFLSALTDETSLKGRLGIPESVPSGLPVDR